MNAAAVPEEGTYDVLTASDAAEVVEELADERTAGSIGRKLIILDIDGTVLREDETLSPGIVEAIADAHDAGHRVMLATGRSWEATRGIQEVLRIEPEYAVCSNGAVVMRRAPGVDTGYERYHIETFDATEVLTLLREHLPTARYLVELPDGRREYTEYLDDWSLEYARRVPFDELARHPVTRVVVIAPDQTAQDFVGLVSRIGLNQVSYAVGWTAWLDIAPKDVDKGTALELVRGWLGVDPADVIVFGDGRNDIGMFQWAIERGGHAVAMAQGPQEVLDAAAEVTGSVSEGGVARVIARLL